MAKKTTNMFCACGNEVFVGSTLEDDLNMLFVVEEHESDGSFVLSAQEFPKHPFCLLADVVERVYVVG